MFYVDDLKFETEEEANNYVIENYPEYCTCKDSWEVACENMVTWDDEE